MFESTFSTLLFVILKVICWAINRLTQLFEVFSGLTKVTYRGEETFLFDVFLKNSAVNNIYWGMALIGIVLIFAFAIFSAARKMFDLNNKNPMSTGQIVTETVKSFVLIISMNLILTLAITGTDVLLRQINYLFTRAEGLDRPQVMEYTDEQYSAMGRALSTIANYGMNPSYNSRYNVNDCFNTIRPDLVYLEQQHIFDYNYQTTGVNSWQSALQEVANSADLRYELKSDVYYETVVAAMEHVLEIMKNDASFRPLERFEQYYTGNVNDIPLDRVVFLVGTLGAANNNYFNKAPSFDDALRYPYYTGEKSLYDTETTSSIDVISGDFSLNYSRFDYLVSFVLGIAILYNTFVILLNLVARMFNILFLYIIAPPVLASRPLDGGAKTKQWTTAFIIQLLGVFGNIIVMRLLLIFIPVIFDPTLVLIQGNAMLNYFGKAVILIAAYSVAKKAGSLLSGILSDTAGMQSMQTGEMSSVAQRSIYTARNAVRSAGAAVAGAAGFAAAPMLNTMKKPFESYKNLGKESKRGQLAKRFRMQLPSDAQTGGSGGSGGPGQPGSLPGNVAKQPGSSEIAQGPPNVPGSGNLQQQGQKDPLPQQNVQRPRAGSMNAGKAPSLSDEKAQSVNQPGSMRNVEGKDVDNAPGGGQQLPGQQQRRGSVPQKDISDFMRQSYRLYDNEVSKNSKE